MKKTSWPIWIVFTAAAAGLRAWQTLAGFEESGLARRGFVPGLLLPAVLLAAAAYFVWDGRTLPPRRADALRLARDFRFADNMPAVFLAVAGPFLVMLGSVLFVRAAGGTAVSLLLAAFAVAAALSVLSVVFALYRGNEAQNLALLVPICALVVFLIFIYRTNASDPVLARTYVETLAVAALTLSAAQRAAFVFGGSAPRRFVPLGALSALLALTAAADGSGLSHIALLVGSAAIELGFLTAAAFEE